MVDSKNEKREYGVDLQDGHGGLLEVRLVYDTFGSKEITKLHQPV